MATRPANVTLTVYQGQTFDDQILFQDQSLDPLDFTGMTARMQVRWAVPDSTVIATYSTADGTIVELSDAGTIVFNVSAVATAALPTDNVQQCWVYDLEVVDGTTVTRLMQGSFVVVPEVTRS